jgi:hypothetical protein
MATPIQFPTLAQFTPYAQVSDIMNLIGNVGPIADGTITTTQITTALAQASRYLDQKTNRFFSPRRLVKQYDGNGKTRFQLPDRPLMYVNSLNIYFSYPFSLTRTANDWDLLLDRPRGNISFPTYTQTPFFQPFGFVFFRGSKNIQLDAWYGYTETVYGDILSTSDNQNFTLTFPTAVPLSKMTPTVDLTNSPPTFTPTIYVNGNAVANEVLSLVTTDVVLTQTEWEVGQNDLVYSALTNNQGITGITFNTPLQPTDVVTADYDYWYIPEDITDACAKKAAITLLASIATYGGYSDVQFQGAVEVSSEGGRIRFNDTLGKFGHQITIWQSEILDVIQSRKAILAQFGQGYVDEFGAV